MLDAPSVLFGVVDTGFWSLGQTRTWADRVIDQLSAPAVWLLNLSVASTTSDAAEVLRRAFRERCVTLSDDVGDLMVGLLYWRFRQGHLDAERFIAEVADVLDAYESSTLDVETWNTEMTSGNAASSPLEGVLENLFQQATAAVGTLEEVTDRRTDPFFSET